MARAVKIAGEVLEKFVGETHSKYLRFYQGDKGHMRTITRDPLLGKFLAAEIQAINYYTLA